VGSETNRNVKSRSNLSTAKAQGKLGRAKEKSLKTFCSGKSSRENGESETENGGNNF